MSTPTRADMRRNEHEGAYDMRVAMAVVILITSTVGATAKGSPYNAAAAYGACQVDALQGLHYPMNGHCPNWQAWKARHMQVQTPPHGRVYPTSRSRHHVDQ
jgi:hypothetical protein